MHKHDFYRLMLLVPQEKAQAGLLDSVAAGRAERQEMALLRAEAAAARQHADECDSRARKALARMRLLEAAHNDLKQKMQVK